jgi:hypothetical protein
MITRLGMRLYEPVFGSSSAALRRLTRAILSWVEQGFILKLPPTKNLRAMAGMVVVV